jgi:PqqD family protein of HPr-rel-A system
MVKAVYWTLNRKLEPSLRHFGDESVFYANASGDTHLLSGLSARVMACLSEYGLSVDQVLNELYRPAAELRSLASLKHELERTLQDLERIGLVIPKSKMNSEVFVALGNAAD